MTDIVRQHEDILQELKAATTSATDHFKAVQDARQKITEAVEEFQARVAEIRAQRKEAQEEAQVEQIKKDAGITP